MTITSSFVKTRSFTLAAYAQGDPGATKLALVLPGRLDTKDYAHMSAAVDFLATCGYFALSFDPPGTWESPGGIELFTTTNYIKAIHELIEHFGTKPTLLFGHSRGGATAMLAGATHPVVNGIVAVMANYGPPTAPGTAAQQAGFKIEKRDLPPGTKATTEQKVFRLPMNYFEDGEQYNPREALQTCTTPKLLFAGTKDEFCGPEKAQRIYDSIPDPKMLHVLESPHDYRYQPEVITEVHEMVGKFLEDNGL